jgi:hypothetical protein
MSRRSGASVRVRGLALVGLCGLGTCNPRTKAAESRGPFLSILQPDGRTNLRTTVTPASVALALGGLPPEELPRLRQHLAESTDGVLRRAAPELFDLDERPGDAGADPLRQMLPDLPALTAAANLLGSPWEGSGISVVLTPGCEPAASRCTPVFAPAATTDEPLVRRARALAWALGNAALLGVSASAREGLLHSLREVQLRPAGTVAIVYASARGSIDGAELDRLRHEARQALDQLRPDAQQRPWLDALDAARTNWELPVALDADQVLVIPRLSALARLQDFVAEVESAGTFKWVVRPGGR